MTLTSGLRATGSPKKPKSVHVDRIATISNSPVNGVGLSGNVEQIIPGSTEKPRENGNERASTSIRHIYASEASPATSKTAYATSPQNTRYLAFANCLASSGPSLRKRFAPGMRWDNFGSGPGNGKHITSSPCPDGIYQTLDKSCCVAISQISSLSGAK